MKATLIDKWSVIITIASLIFSWALFWSYTGDPIGSFSAAAIAAGMVFLAYVVMRMVIMAIRR